MTTDESNFSKKVGMTLSFGSEQTPSKGWIHLIKERKVPSEAPWRKGSLIKVNNSPAPSKILNNSVVMFLEHSLIKYKVSETEYVTVVESKDTEDELMVTAHERKETDHLQHRITVLFDEKIVNLYSQELRGNFGEVDKQEAGTR